MSLLALFVACAGNGKMSLAPYGSDWKNVPTEMRRKLQFSRHVLFLGDSVLATFPIENPAPGVESRRSPTGGTHLLKFVVLKDGKAASSFVGHNATEYDDMYLLDQNRLFTIERYQISALDFQTGKTSYSIPKAPEEVVSFSTNEFLVWHSGDTGTSFKAYNARNGRLERQFQVDTPIFAAATNGNTIVLVVSSGSGVRPALYQQGNLKFLPVPGMCSSVSMTGQDQFVISG
jgi:hypothetical protein